jgi:three-Cys-motif partner protein
LTDSFDDPILNRYLFATLAGELSDPAPVGVSPTKNSQLRFFSESSEASKVKAEIIAKYFSAWAMVVSRTTRGRRIAYVDLFAGRGRYEDGTPSTPLLILERALRDPIVREMLVSVFNDRDHAVELESEIEALPNIEKLKHRPLIDKMDVQEQTAELFKKIRLLPTLAFVDPWGYRGLSRELIQALLKDWGCDCVFFFNYNRINMGLTNSRVAKHMEAIFGPAWLTDLRQQVPGLRPTRRERIVLSALKKGLRELGGDYVRPFRFLRANGRTSHYLVFVTKSFKGVEIMRDVMAGMSSSSADGVASFAYDPRVRDETQLELLSVSPLDRLAERIKRDLGGSTLTVRELFERHSSDSRFTFRNYQEALRRLEGHGHVRVTRPSGRQSYAGRATMPENATITVSAR